MSSIVYRISVVLGAILTEVSVGTNLGLFWLLWALISENMSRLPSSSRIDDHVERAGQ